MNWKYIRFILDKFESFHQSWRFPWRKKVDSVFAIFVTSESAVATLGKAESAGEKSGFLKACMNHFHWTKNWNTFWFSWRSCFCRTSRQPTPPKKLGKLSKNFDALNLRWLENNQPSAAFQPSSLSFFFSLCPVGCGLETSCLEEMGGNFPWEIQGHLEKIQVCQLVPFATKIYFQSKIPGIFWIFQLYEFF